MRHGLGADPQAEIASGVGRRWHAVGGKHHRRIGDCIGGKGVIKKGAVMVFQARLEDGASWS